MFWITIILGVISAVLTGFVEENAAAAGIILILDLAVLIITIIQNVKLSKAYGHGIGFAVGLILLNPIFMLILGLGSSQYIGKEEN